MSTVRGKLFVGVAIATLGVLAAVPVAGARRSPTRSEAAAISKALHSSPATSLVRCFHVRHIVVSTVGPWARANTEPCDKRRFDSALSVLQRRKGRWRLRDIGTSGAGCTVAPPPVRRDLRLICV